MVYPFFRAPKLKLYWKDPLNVIELVDSSEKIVHRIGVVTFTVRNIGGTIAKSCKPFFYMPKPSREERIVYDGLWGIIDRPPQIEGNIPDIQEIGHHVIDAILRETESVGAEKRDIHNIREIEHPFTIIFTVEGMNRAYIIEPRKKELPIPASYYIGVGVSGDNLPKVEKTLFKITFKSWNNIQIERKNLRLENIVFRLRKITSRLS